MPMIDFTYPAGTIAPEAKEKLLDQLAGTLLQWEGAPDNDFYRSITWVYAHEADVAVGGRSGGEPRFRVQVTVPAGVLSDRRKAGLVKDTTALVLAAAGLADADGLRVWTFINEVPQGNWAAAGAVVDFAALRGAAKNGESYTPQGAPVAS